MNFYIADLHFGHTNILKLNNRPFSTIEEMNETLIHNWNSVVTNNDDVYILGDFFYKSSESPAIILQKLKGKKHLIIGNHDGVIMKNPDLQKYFKSIDKYNEINDNGTLVVLFHYPIIEWNGFFRNSVHLYGHIHNNENNFSNKTMPSIKNAYNVGADLVNYTPQTLPQIISLFSKKE